MAVLTFLRNFVAHIGSVSASPSTGGGLNSRLGALMPYVVGTTGALAVYPSTVSPIGVSPPDSVWGTSGFTTIQSSGTLSAHMLVGYTDWTPVLPRQIDFASGAVGAEVVQFSVRSGSGCAGPVFPPVQWPANERVSARVSGNSTASGTTVAATFAPRPL